jgi:SRP54-type protein, helical bundle domain
MVVHRGTLLALAAALGCAGAFVSSAAPALGLSSFAARARSPQLHTAACQRARALPLQHRMLFDSLTEKMAGIGEMLQGKKKITAASVERALGEVKRALLDADVNLKASCA